MSIDEPSSPVTTALRDNFARLIAERTTGFSGREWVFDAVDQWLGAPGQGHPFLLGGRPGTGKTAIAARLVQMHRGEQSAQARANLQPGCLAHYHFCQAGSESTLSPQDFVQSLAESLAAKYPDYRKSLESRSSPQYNVTVNTGAVTGGTVTGVRVNIQVVGGDARGLFDELVRRPLRDLCAAQPSERIVILVDSLDEALTFHSTNHIARLVAAASDLPAGVRFLLTARSGIDAVERLVGAPTLDLIADAPPGLDEVRVYAAARLGKLPASAKAVVAQRLADQSRGNFLYAYHVLNLLERVSLSPAQLETFPFPNALEDMYGEMVQRQMAADAKLWTSQFRPMLGAIAVAHGDGLTRDQLIGITGLAEDVADDVLNAAGEYLMGGVDGGAYRLYHQSFREFLLRDKEFGVYPAERHAAVARWFEDQHAASWESCRDDYALRYTARHWAESAEISTPTARPARTQSAVDLALNAKYQRAFERRVANLTELRDVVFGALRAATLNERVDMLPCVVRASLGYLQFNRDYLQAEALVKLAEVGSVAEASARTRLFPDISDQWHNAARLILCWLALDKAPALAKAEFDRMPSFAGINPVLARLQQRLAAAIRREDVTCPPVPAADIELGRQIVSRFSGNDYNQEMLGAAVNPSLMGAYRVSMELDLDGSNQYAAASDAPILVGIARGGTDAAEGTELFDRYVQAHAGYNYILYRNESLWFLLESVVRLMVDQQWVLRRLKLILVAALTGGAVEYREMLPMTAELLRRRLDADQGKGALKQLIVRAQAEARTLQDVRGANDVWGDHKRRHAALMELCTRVAGEVPLADQLRQGLWQLPEGFAGFQAPAFLRLADALAACGDALQGDRARAMEQASIVAQRIQDYHFCARVNARCNTLRQWHARSLDAAALADAVARLARGLGDVEFSSEHAVRDAFAHRHCVDAKLRSIEPARAADTLEKLAEVFQRPVADFQAFNPGIAVDAALPAGTVIRVPDPGLAPLLAIHLAARILAESALAGDQASLIRRLLPVAAINATALDTLLSYLLIASEPTDPGLLDQLVAQAGPVIFGKQPVPVGQVGPDSVLPA